MKAAVVLEPGRPPRWAEFADPDAANGETLVAVRAAALSPLARARAAGTHYSSGAAGTFVAGIDGVGRLPDGSRVYFAFPRSPFGAMAQYVPARAELTAPVPDDLDDATAAALANPAMSSWAALMDRAKFEKGESVLVNGATGAAGRLAVQIAKYFGAKKVVATGRDPAKLQRAAELGADRTISLTLPADQLADALHSSLIDDEVAIVLDYLWGASASQLLRAIARNQSGSFAPRIRYVQIGAASGAEISLDASLLRGSGVELLGSGLRSISLAGLVSRIGETLAAAVPARLDIDVQTEPMETVEAGWHVHTAGRRLVFTL